MHNEIETNNIYEKVIASIREVAQKPLLGINCETLFDDIEDWDSLNTVDLEITIEADMDIDFNPGEFQTYKSIGYLVDAIEMKVK